MSAFSRASGTAASESCLNSMISGNNIMAFEKLNREERNLRNQFNVLFFDFQMFTESSVNSIVIILKTKCFQSDFIKLFLTGNRKYVGMSNQEFFLTKVGK
jgi:hypothetical protein